MLNAKTKVLLGKFSTVGAVVGTALVGTVCHAEAGPVVAAISTQVTSLTADALVVIGSAVGLSAIFFGAKLIWGKFKGMAK